MLIQVIFFLLTSASLAALVWSGFELFREEENPLAARLPRLDVLFDASGEQDPDLAHDLARLGRGRVRPIRSYRDVAPALGELFAG